MKKILGILTVLTMSFGAVSCGSDDDGGGPEDPNKLKSGSFSVGVTSALDEGDTYSFTFTATTSNTGNFWEVNGQERPGKSLTIDQETLGADFDIELIQAVEQVDVTVNIMNAEGTDPVTGSYNANAGGESDELNFDVSIADNRTYTYN